MFLYFKEIENEVLDEEEDLSSYSSEEKNEEDPDWSSSKEVTSSEDLVTEEEEEEVEVEESDEEEKEPKEVSKKKKNNKKKVLQKKKGCKQEADKKSSQDSKDLSQKPGSLKRKKRECVKSIETLSFDKLMDLATEEAMHSLSPSELKLATEVMEEEELKVRGINNLEKCWFNFQFFPMISKTLSYFNISFFRLYFIFICQYF